MNKIDENWNLGFLSFSKIYLNVPSDILLLRFYCNLLNSGIVFFGDNLLKKILKTIDPSYSLKTEIFLPGFSYRTNLFIAYINNLHITMYFGSNKYTHTFSIFISIV